MNLVLASASAIRRDMLDAADIPYAVHPARVDEDAIKAAHDGDDLALARALAEAKALETATRLSGNWVIGGDSLVSVDGRRFDKPPSRQDAANHLKFFSGKDLILTSAVALVNESGTLDWSHAEAACLKVRQLSDSFIHNYLEAEWPAVSACVGVFRMEGRGVQLFESMEGSYFTILGMPLLPLLGAMRDRRLLPS